MTPRMTGTPKKRAPSAAVELLRAEALWFKQEAKRVELENWKLELERKHILSSASARGVFLLGEAVDDDIVHQLMERMTIWSAHHPKAPVTLLINSPGGVVISGNAFYDFLEDLKTRHFLTTKAVGMAASMGAIIFQAGHDRVMSKRAWLLVHEVQGLVAGSFSHMEDDMKFNERLQTQALDILAGRCTMTKEEIKSRWKRQDWWLDAEDAVKAGFADRIGE